MLLNDRVMVYLDIDDCYLDTVGDVYIGTVDSKFSDGSVTVDGMYFIQDVCNNIKVITRKDYPDQFDKEVS